MPAPVEPRRRAVLPPLPAAAARAALSPPRLPATAVAAAVMAREAAALALPVRLDVPAGYGRTLLARALHAEGGRPGPLVVAEGRRRALHHLPAGASVLLDLDTVTEPAAAVLEALLDDGAAWLLVAAPAGAALPIALASRLDGVTLRIPPLHQRPADVPALARHVVAVLGSRRGAPPALLTDAAIAWLVAQPWPGDVAELEATLGRALLRAGASPIGVAHLAEVAGAAPAPPDDRRAHLEYLVAQLAHELRNPLTAVKAFAQLPGLGDDPALRTRFAALTDDAIARMDALLENASAFAGLGTPAPGDVDLGPLLDGLVAEIRPGLAARAIPLDYASPNGARCTADRAQLAYALRNVLAGAAHEAPPQHPLRIDAATPGVVRIDFDDRGTAGGLGRVLAEDDTPAPLQLPFTLARAVLERNGGTLAVQRQPDGRALLEVRLPGS